MAFFRDPLAGIAYSTNQLSKADMNDWITGIREAHLSVQNLVANNWTHEVDVTAILANFLAKCCAHSHTESIWVVGGAVSGSATNAIITSMDCVHWVTRTVPNTGSANSIDAMASAWQAAIIIGGCDDGTFRRSTDGATWTEESPAAITSVTCMHHGGRCGLVHFYAGSTGEVEVSDAGGTVWVGSTAFPSSLSTHAIKDIADNANSSSPIMVAVGNTGTTDKCARTVDGATWTEGTLPATAAWNSVCWSHQLAAFVAVDEGATNWATSADGTTWSALSVTTGPGSNVAMLRCLGQVLVVVKSASGDIYTSRDNGANWLRAYDAAGTLTDQDQRAMCFAESTTGRGQIGVAENVYFLASLDTGA